MADGSCFFKGRRIVLLTKHGKEMVIKPTLEKATGCQVIVDTSFDTDQLGTFTREIARHGTQLEAARCKAQKGMELTRPRHWPVQRGKFWFPSLNFFFTTLVANLREAEVFPKRKECPEVRERRRGDVNTAILNFQRSIFLVKGERYK